MLVRNDETDRLSRPFAGTRQAPLFRFFFLALTAFTFVLHGYHPYAEDGGLYVAGIKKLLNPHLYPYQTVFVTEHLRFSVFAPFIAWTTRITHFPLPWLLLLLYWLTLWATLGAASMLAQRCFASSAARLGSVVLFACWITLPIAGTSLFLLDPYLTARSFSTPLTLMALALALDPFDSARGRSLIACAGLLTLAFAIHPLMAAYGTLAVLVVLCLTPPRPRLLLALFASVLVAATVVNALAPQEPAGYLRVALTRDYWFPGEWFWYERFGLAAPLLLIAAALLLKNRASRQACDRTVATLGVTLGLLSLTVAACFSRDTLSSHLVASLQPLRCFQIVYAIMILLLGGAAGEYWLKDHLWRWIVLIGVASTPIYFGQRAIFPATAHLEMPWSVSRNPWIRAFLWIRENTPADALFAMNPHYIDAPHEDAQGFRAIAERSALPDSSKDGGEAAIMPSLTAIWIAGQTAQAGIDDESDGTRIQRLQPLGVTWIILSAHAQTGFLCPYRNPAVQVCRLP